MGRGYGQYIRGRCLNVINDNNFNLFRTITAHVVCNSPTGVGYSSGIFACGTNAPFTTELGTRIVPDAYVFPNGSVFRAKDIYGQTVDTVGLKTYGGDPVYFCEADLEFWRSRNMYVPNVYRMYASGPAVQSAHAWMPLQRKRKTNNVYQGRLDYDFVDASQPIQPTTTSTTTPEPPVDYTTTTPAPEPPPCRIDDWLVFQHPASPLWTNLREPFLATDFYEQSGQFPPRSSKLGGENFMPFCDPLPVRDADGVVLGSYVGYTFSLVFGQAQMSFPVRPYLPPDPNSPLPNPPPVFPGAAFYSLEVAVYLASDTPELASPLLNRRRYWMYSNAGLSGGFQWFDPYFAMLFGPMNSMWYFDVIFEYYYGGSETINFNLSDMNVLVGA